MSFGFTTPAALAVIGSVLPIAWLYLRLRRRPPRLVSSLVLWRTLPEVHLVRKRPRLPVLFFIEALLIAALSVALAGPFAWTEAPPYLAPDRVLVLDVSASMQALEGGSSRFTLAEAAAVDLVRESSATTPATRFTVIAAGLHPRVFGTGLGADQTVAALGTLEPLDTAGNPTAAVELGVAQVGATGSVDLFSDATFDSLVLSRDARAITTVHRFGTSNDNAAIVGLRVLENRFEEQSSARVLVTVKNFALKPRQAAVELRPRSAGVVTADGLPTHDLPATGGPRRSLTLDPRESQVVSFDGITWSGPFEVLLSPHDDLALDDVVRGFIAPREPLRVLLVSEEAGIGRELDELARRLGSLSLTVVSPAAYRPTQGPEVTLFDRYAPPLPPPGNVAYLAPRQGNGDVTIVGTTSDLRYAEVREHELLDGVQNPETLLTPGMVGLASSGTLRPVLLGRAEGSEAALVLAGTIGERRVVATAFRLRVRPRDPDQLPSLIFTLNLLRWLAPPPRGAPLEHLAGATIPARFPDASAITSIEGPGGTRNLGPSEEVLLERAGVYRVAGGEARRELIVNFIDPSESDIGRPPFTEEPAVRPAEHPALPLEAGVRRLRVPRARQVLAAAAAVMLLEWLWIAWVGRRAPEGRHA